MSRPATEEELNGCAARLRAASDDLREGRGIQDPSLWEDMVRAADSCKALTAWKAYAEANARLLVCYRLGDAGRGGGASAADKVFSTRARLVALGEIQEER